MRFDVVIIGFGTSGFFVAFELIKAGLRVAVIESENFIGASLVSSLVFPTAGFHTLNGKLIITDGVREFLDFCVENGFSKGHIRDPLNFSYSITPIDPLAYNVFFVKYFLGSLGKNFMLFSKSQIEDIQEKSGIIKSIVIKYNGKRLRISANFFVDASGILKLSDLLDIDYRFDFNNLQACTLIFRISGVNFKKIIEYMKNNKDDFYYKTDLSLVLKEKFLSVSGYFNLASKTLFNSDLFLSRDRFLFFGDIDKNTIYVNTSRIFFKDIVDFILKLERLKKEDFLKECGNYTLPILKPVSGENDKGSIEQFDIKKYGIDSISYDFIERVGYYLSIKQVIYIYNVMRSYIEGFENSYIDLVANKLGVRQYKILNGDYVLSLDDVIKLKDFDDKICIGTWPIDIHIKDKVIENKVDENGYFIPFRSLITKKYKNLIFVGKHISSDDYAFSSLRIQATCMNMGSIVGKLLVNLINKKTYILDVDFSLLKEIFKKSFF